METTIRTEQDERNQHAIIITHRQEERIYARHYSSDVILSTAAAVRRDLARHGIAALDQWLADKPLAKYRTTKSGKRLLLAENA